MDMRRSGGRNSKRLRRQKGFTQETFAEAAGATQQYVSDLERGLRNPTVVTLYHLASALGVSHVDLVVPDDEARREASKTSSGRSSKPKQERRIGCRALRGIKRFPEVLWLGVTQAQNCPTRHKPSRASPTRHRNPRLRAKVAASAMMTGLTTKHLDHQRESWPRQRPAPPTTRGRSRLIFRSMRHESP